MRWDTSVVCWSLAIFATLLMCWVDGTVAPGEIKVCNRTLKASMGWIRWTGRMGKCVVRIRAPSKDPQVIEIKIRRMQVGVFTDHRCEGAFIQFTDNVEDLDEEAGRFCGHIVGNDTRTVLRRGPDLTLVLESEAKFANDNPVMFMAQYSVLPLRLAFERHHHLQQQQPPPPSPFDSFSGTSVATSECPLECMIRNDRRTCRLLSPGYPGVYPRGIRCRIALESSLGRFRIGGTVEDIFSLMNHTSQKSCLTEFCEQEHLMMGGGQANPTEDGQRDAENFENGSGNSGGRDREEDRDETMIIVQSTQSTPSPETPQTTGSNSKKANQSNNQRRRGKSSHRRVQRSKFRGGGGGAKQDRRKSRISGNSQTADDKNDEADDDDDDDDLDHADGDHFQEVKFGSRYNSQGARGNANLNSMRREFENDQKNLEEKEYDDEDEDEEEDEENTREGEYEDVEEQEEEEENSEDENDFTENLFSKPKKKTQVGDHMFAPKNRWAESPFSRRYQYNGVNGRLGTTDCPADYLSLQENVNGRVVEIIQFCGVGQVPQIVSRGPNLIIEFYAERDGTILNEGFHLTVSETEASPSSLVPDRGCDYHFRSSEHSRGLIRSPKSWYPAKTICTYKFHARSSEKVSVQLKIVKTDKMEDEELERPRNTTTPKPRSHDCAGNEVSVYNSAKPNGIYLVWSFCDAEHDDINNIEVPIVSTGNALLVQFYSTRGSYDGLDFSYVITYRFVKKQQPNASANTTKRRQIVSEETRHPQISLQPLNVSVTQLNLDAANCDCDFADRIGNFKSWFIVLVVLGVISFGGAVLVIVALFIKCARVRRERRERKLIYSTPARSPFFKGSATRD